jgi:hypothetical protein
VGEEASATVTVETPVLPEPDRTARLSYRWRRIARKVWLIGTWRLGQWWGRQMCTLNLHQWKDAPALDRNGEFDLSKPGRFQACERPACRIFRGKPRLVHVGHWLETDDFIVLARTDCKRCCGRGYTGRMMMDDGGRCLVPCACLRVQPGYISYPPKPPTKPRTKPPIRKGKADGQAGDVSGTDTRPAMGGRLGSVRESDGGHRRRDGNMQPASRGVAG